MDDLWDEISREVYQKEAIKAMKSGATKSWVFPYRAKICIWKKDGVELLQSHQVDGHKPTYYKKRQPLVKEDTKET